MNERETAVRRLFSRLAPHYGLLNTVLTGGLHYRWRRFAVAQAAAAPGTLFLDLCAGTGDLSLVLARHGARVIAVDMAEPMLAIARRRAAGRLETVVADALHLPLAPGVFDGAIVGFGLRHCEDDLPLLLRDLRRVLKTGARLVILELSHPPARFWRGLTGLYIHHLVPLVGALVDAEAYRYLSASLHEYPDAPGLRGMLLEAGFAECQYHLLAGGVIAVHVATA